jgi:hypothetical protein
MEDVKPPRKKKLQLSLAESLELGYDSDEEFHWAPNPHQMEAELHVLNGEWAGQEVLQDWQNSVAVDWQTWFPTGCTDEFFEMTPMLVGNDWYDNSMLQAEVIYIDFEGDHRCYSYTTEAEAAVYSKFEAQIDDNGGDADTSAPESEGLDPSSEVEGSTSDVGEATFDMEVASAAVSIAAGSAKDALVQEDYSRQDGFWRPDFYTNLSHKIVPRKADFTKPEFERSSESCGDTTMMLRNLPNEYTRSMLMSELDKAGFFATYDFIYVPIDKCTHWNVGYAFVNFLSPEIAERCKREFAGRRLPSEDPRPAKVMQVCRAHVQGLEKNVEYYKQSAVMTSRHESHRPLIIPGGTREEASSEAENTASSAMQAPGELRVFSQKESACASS